MSETDQILKLHHESHNKGWDWRKTLGPEVEQSVPPVFQKVLDRAQETLTHFKTEYIEPGRLAVVISAYDAKDVLPKTLKELVEQIKQSKLQGEIFVVLNNGGGNTTDFISADMQEEQIEKIKSELGVDDIIFGQTGSLDCKGSSNTKGVPRPITTDKQIPTTAEGVILVVIKQQQEQDNSGKIRALRDIYSFLIALNQETGYCPQYALVIDSETRFRPVDIRKKQISINANEGLLHMVKLSNEGRKMVGAKLQFIPYDKNGDPHWEEKPPPMQLSISIMHGMRGYEWLPGGGTLGGFPEIISILGAISQNLPGTRIEDVLATVAAKALGITTVVDNEVIHTNRCPSKTDKKDVFQQMLRWLKGAKGLEFVAGKPLSGKVISNNLVRIFAYPLIELAKGIEINVPYLLRGLPYYIRASRLAKNEPDDFIGGEATFK